MGQPKSPQTLELINFQENTDLTRKTFPDYQLGLIRFKFIVRDWISKTANWLLSREFSAAEVQRAILRANEERQLLNTLKVQRLVLKIQRLTTKCIKRNQSSVILCLGDDSPENKILLEAAQRFYHELGLSESAIIVADGKLFFQLDLKYT